MSSLLNPVYSSFVPNRYINDNIMVIKEIVIGQSRTIKNKWPRVLSTNVVRQRGLNSQGDHFSS